LWHWTDSRWQSCRSRPVGKWKTIGEPVPEHLKGTQPRTYAESLEERLTQKISTPHYDKPAVPLEKKDVPSAEVLFASLSSKELDDYARQLLALNRARKSKEHSQNTGTR